MHKAAGIVVALAAVALLSAAGCSREDAGPPPADGPNVLLIAVDTLRADKLGCYGSTLGATPRIDALAEESVRFEKAYSHAPWTLPSFASLFTSQTPAEHGAGGQVPMFRMLEDSAHTIAECFQERGYTTASVINVVFLTQSLGMTQGFQNVDDEAYQTNVEVRDATKTTDAAVAWLRKPRKRPFFLFVHYFDPHLVYNPPAEFRQRFAAPPDQDNANWVFGTRQQIGAYRAGALKFNEATIRRAEKLYNGEVAYADHEIGRLLDALGEMKLTDSTVIVFTADHGEEFLDHGGFEHGHTLYDELVHVPLMIRYPERLEPGVVSYPVGHADVAPTLCALVGIKPYAEFTGRDLFNLGGGDPNEHPIYMEGNFWGAAHRGWLHNGYKLIVEPGGLKLYNLNEDPGETRNLSIAERDRATEMLRDMNLAREAMLARTQGEAAAAQLTPAEWDRLRSLGYVGSAPTSQP